MQNLHTNEISKHSTESASRGDTNLRLSAGAPHSFVTRICLW
jgi:hypothetical protein